MNHVGRGGAALALYDLIKEFKRNHAKVDSVVITGLYNQLNVALTENDIENYSAPFKNFLSSYTRPAIFWKLLLRLRYCFFKPIAIKKIEKLIDFKSIDIIHSNLNRIDIGHYFAKKYDIPHIWHIREHDFDLMPVFSSDLSLLMDNTSTYIAISESVKLAWTVRGVPEQMINLIYDGIDSNFWSHNELKRKNKKLSFIFLGGYHIDKGQELFIQVLKSLPPLVKNNIVVHFFGDGPKKYKYKLICLIKKNNLEDCCRIFDYDPNIYRKLSRYHIGVNCSKAEGFGRVTVEYMMAGLCPLVSNSGASPEIVDNKVNGLTFDRENSLSIKEKIIFLYNNKQIIKELSEKAKLKAASTFSMTNHANKIYELYTHTLN